MLLQLQLSPKNTAGPDDSRGDQAGTSIHLPGGLKIVRLVDAEHSTSNFAIMNK